VKILALGLLTLAMCGLAPPEGPRPFRAPDHYREVWRQAEACSGKTGDYDRVKWHVIPGPAFPCKVGKCIGEWNQPHEITIAGDFQNTDWVIRHEILHDLVGSHYPGDTLLWGVACKATWGWLVSDDSLYVP
jgi:hypothetical protein